VELKDIDNILRTTLEDLRLSRGERRALGELLGELGPDDAETAYLCNRAFEIAREATRGRDNLLVLDWLEQVAKILRVVGGLPETAVRAEARFTPDDNCPAKIADLFAAARRTADACVFTITDDRISRAILHAHRRGVAVRIITDGEKALDPGSDIEAFRHAGIAVRTDRSEYHMHHKFAVFDDERVLTGSYNWTRTAALHNQENFVVTDDPRLVGAFRRAFEALWRRFKR